MDITEYIKNHKILSDLPFVIVYMVITILIEDGYILHDVDKV